MSRFSSTSTPKSFTTGQLFFHLPGCTGAGVCPDTGAGPCTWPCWTSRACLGPTPWAWLSLQVASLPSCQSTTPLTSVSSADLLGVHSIPLTVSNEDTKQYWFQYPWYWYPLRYTTRDWFPLDIEPFGHWAATVTLSHLTVHPSNFYLSNSVATKLQATLSKALQKSGWMTSIALVHWCSHSVVEGH